MIKKATFRIAAVALGLLMVVGGLETALRIAAVRARSRSSISESLPQEHEIRILFLGESTTACEWPDMVGEILNRRRPDQRIRIINRASAGAVTGHFSKLLPGWLEVDRPHIVVGMLGINDRGNVLVYRRPGARPGFVDRLLTFKLGYLLWRSAFAVGRPEIEVGHVEEVDEETFETIARLTDQRHEARTAFRDSEAIGLDMRLLRADPGPPIHYLADAVVTISWPIPEQDLDRFIISEIGVDPKNASPSELRALVESWMRDHPEEFGGLRQLTGLLRRQEDHQAVRAVLEDAAESSAYRGFAGLRLARHHFLSEETEVAERRFREAIVELPDVPELLLVAGDIAVRIEAWEAAIDVHKHYLDRAASVPFSVRRFVYARLETVCAAADRHAEALSWQRHRESLELGRFSVYTRYHYQRVVDMVHNSGASFLAVQYPTLTIVPLRKLLDYRDDVVFVENHDDFVTAIAEDGYYELFFDRFAGGFGHFTERGNQMLAENVADALSEMMGLPPPTDR